MKTSLLLVLAFVPVICFAAYDCTLDILVDGKWKQSGTLNFTGNTSDIGIDGSGKYELLTKEGPGIASLEIKDIQRNTTVGGTVSPAGKPMTVWLPDFRISCMAAHTH
jgi:hypothetical protein